MVGPSGFRSFRSVYVHCFHSAALYIFSTSHCGSILLFDLNISVQWSPSAPVIGPLRSFHLGLFISEGSLPVPGSKTVQRGHFNCIYGIGFNRDESGEAAPALLPFSSGSWPYLRKILCSTLKSYPATSISDPLPCSGSALQSPLPWSFPFLCPFQLARLTGQCALAAYIQDSIV